MPGFGHYVEQDQVTQVPTEIADPKKKHSKPKAGNKNGEYASHSHEF